MPSHKLKLVTIVCEALIQEPVTRMLLANGAQGYTLFPVEGYGSQGRRGEGMIEYGNLRIETLVSDETAEKIFVRLKDDFIDRYALVAYETEAKVIRGKKF